VVAELASVATPPDTLAMVLPTDELEEDWEPVFELDLDVEALEPAAPAVAAPAPATATRSLVAARGGPAELAAGPAAQPTEPVSEAPPVPAEPPSAPSLASATGASFNAVAPLPPRVPVAGVEVAPAAALPAAAAQSVSAAPTSEPAAGLPMGAVIAVVTLLCGLGMWRWSASHDR
jgi:hypothetical protein